MPRLQTCMKHNPLRDSTRTAQLYNGSRCLNHLNSHFILKKQKKKKKKNLIHTKSSTKLTKF